VSIEFMQYILQILAQLLESSPPETLSSNYTALVDPVLSATMWETRGNIPACTRLLAALLPRASADIIAGDKLKQVLGIFQMLLSGKRSELYAFDLLEAILISFEPYVEDVQSFLLLDLLSEQASLTDAC
jgi:exportin-2 (importin alpha re-exporter)